MHSISFYAHHSPFGAYSSFILGKLGSGGGFALSDVHPPRSNIYLGYKVGNDRPRMLPFFSGSIVSDSSVGEEAYLANGRSVRRTWCQENATVFSENEITRTVTWAGDTWSAGRMRFSIFTPFDRVPHILEMSAEEAKFRLAPVILAQMSLDNTGSSEPMVALFALQGLKRPLSDTTGGSIIGAALGRSSGIAAKAAAGVEEVLDWDVCRSAFGGKRAIRRLGSEGGLVFDVPAGEQRDYIIALGTFQEGPITSGIETRFYYTKLFRSLEEVLAYGLDNAERYLEVASLRDGELASSGLNEHRQFLIAHATKSYHASTELLVDRDSNPVFVVNEGEYRMMNTFDLTVDQLFWEMRYHPWTVRNELDFFLEHYSYVDKVKAEDGSLQPGGLSFCHDQGVANMYSLHGNSSYETPDIDGCFSYMTHEQLTNWILCGSVYALLENDRDWLEARTNVFIDLMTSLINRDGNNDGVMDRDSYRCRSGSEITTYDSLDVSLGQARNNLYLAVKTWAAYVCLEKVFSVLGYDEHRLKAQERASLCAATVESKYDEDEGYIPAVFEEGNTSRIIPAVEGLVFPYILGDIDAVSVDGRYGAFISALRKHLVNILRPGVCLDETSGGWKLSSTSNNTWMSKIAISQFVAQRILGLESDLWDSWDEVHASWQQLGCADFAASDQISSDTGRARGSRLYPRLVTTILWMSE